MTWQPLTSWVGRPVRTVRTTNGDVRGSVRDVLDSRVYDVSRRRTARVAQVWLDVVDGRLRVLGLDVRVGAALARLRGAGSRGRTGATHDLLHLGSVH